MYTAGKEAEVKRGQGSNTSNEKRCYHRPIRKNCATFLKTSEKTGGEVTLIGIAPGTGTLPYYRKIEVRSNEKCARQSPVQPERRKERG